MQGISTTTPSALTKISHQAGFHNYDLIVLLFLRLSTIQPALIACLNSNWKIETRKLKASTRFIQPSSSTQPDAVWPVADSSTPSPKTIKAITITIHRIRPIRLNPAKVFYIWKCIYPCRLHYWLFPMEALADFKKKLSVRMINDYTKTTVVLWLMTMLLLCWE